MFAAVLISGLLTLGIIGGFVGKGIAHAVSGGKNKDANSSGASANTSDDNRGRDNEPNPSRNKGKTKGITPTPGVGDDDTPDNIPGRVSNDNDVPGLEPSLAEEVAKLIARLRDFIENAKLEKEVDLGTLVDKKIESMGVDEAIRNDQEYRNIVNDVVSKRWGAKVDEKIADAEHKIQIAENEGLDAANALEDPILPSSEDFINNETDVIDLTTKKYIEYKQFVEKVEKFRLEANNLSGENLTKAEILIKKLDEKLFELRGYVSDPAYDYKDFVEMVSVVNNELDSWVSQEEKPDEDRIPVEDDEPAVSPLEMQRQSIKAYRERVSAIPTDEELTKIVEGAMGVMGIPTATKEGERKDQKIAYIVDAVRSYRTRIANEAIKHTLVLEEELGKAVQTENANLFDVCVRQISMLDNTLSFEDWRLNPNGLSKVVDTISEKYDMFESLRYFAYGTLIPEMEKLGMSEENLAATVGNLIESLKIFEERIFTIEDPEQYSLAIRSMITNAGYLGKVAANNDKIVSEFKSKIDGHLSELDKKVDDLSEDTRKNIDKLEADTKRRFVGVGRQIGKVMGSIKDLDNKMSQKFKSVGHEIARVIATSKNQEERIAGIDKILNDRNLDILGLREDLNKLSSDHGELKLVVNVINERLANEIIAREKLEINTGKRFKTFGHTLSQLLAQEKDTAKALSSLIEVVGKQGEELSNIRYKDLVELREQLVVLGNENKELSTAAAGISKRLDEEILAREKLAIDTKKRFESVGHKIGEVIASRASDSEKIEMLGSQIIEIFDQIDRISTVDLAGIRAEIGKLSSSSEKIQKALTVTNEKLDQEINARKELAANVQNSINNALKYVDYVRSQSDAKINGVREELVKKINSIEADVINIVNGEIKKYDLPGLIEKVKSLDSTLKALGQNIDSKLQESIDDMKAQIGQIIENMVTKKLGNDLDKYFKGRLEEYLRSVGAHRVIGKEVKDYLNSKNGQALLKRKIADFMESEEGKKLMTKLIKSNMEANLGEEYEKIVQKTIDEIITRLNKAPDNR